MSEARELRRRALALSRVTEWSDPEYCGSVDEYAGQVIRWCDCARPNAVTDHPGDSGTVCTRCGYWLSIGEHARASWHVVSRNRPRDRTCDECQGASHAIACSRGVSAVRPAPQPTIPMPRAQVPGLVTE